MVPSSWYPNEHGLGRMVDMLQPKRRTHYSYEDSAVSGFTLRTNVNFESKAKREDVCVEEGFAGMIQHLGG